MRKEELINHTLGRYGNAFVYLKEDALGFKSGKIFKVIAYDETSNTIKLERKNNNNQSFEIDIERVGLVKPNNGYLQIMSMGLSIDTSSITSFNDIFDNKLKIGDTTKDFRCSSSVDLECYWTPNKKHWWTTIDLLRFIPNDEKEPKAKVDTEEQIPTPLKAVKQATGLSIGMRYTYTPTDSQSEFIGIIEGFMITKAGVFVVDCTGDIIPADKCSKAK